MGATTTTCAELYPDTDWRKEDPGVLQDKLTEYYSKVMQDSVTTNQGIWQSRQKGKNNDNNPSKADVSRTNAWQEQSKLAGGNPDYTIPGYGASSTIVAVPNGNGKYNIMFGSKSSKEGQYPDSHVKDGNPKEYTLEEVKGILKY